MEVSFSWAILSKLKRKCVKLITFSALSSLKPLSLDGSPKRLRSLFHEFIVSERLTEAMGRGGGSSGVTRPITRLHRTCDVTSDCEALVVFPSP